MNTLNLFGFAPSYLAVIMDVCHDVFGVRNFRIHKNNVIGEYIEVNPGVIAFGNPCKVVRDNDKYCLPIP